MAKLWLWKVDLWLVGRWDNQQIPKVTSQIVKFIQMRTWFTHKTWVQPKKCIEMLALHYIRLYHFTISDYIRLYQTIPYISYGLTWFTHKKRLSRTVPGLSAGLPPVFHGAHLRPSSFSISWISLLGSRKPTMFFCHENGDLMGLDGDLIWFKWTIPSGKRLHNSGKSHCSLFSWVNQLIINDHVQ